MSEQLPRITLPDGCTLPYIPTDDDRFAIVIMELIIGWGHILKLYANGDFADGHLMMKQRDEESARYEREQREKDEKGYE